VTSTLLAGPSKSSTAEEGQALPGIITWIDTVCPGGRVPAAGVNVMPLTPLLELLQFSAATFWLAALFLLCRQSLSKMDVPTRQVYIMKLVKPEQRTSAAGITTLARSIATSMSPLAAGALLANSLFVLGLPFLVGGGLSSLYDILLYALFRKIPIEDK